MTDEQKNLVKKSFEKIESTGETAAGLFYARLFEINPELRALFKSDISEQGKKLMQMLGAAVRGLDRLDEIVPAVRALGARHAAYGVRDGDYETVAAALLWTFEKLLGAEFTAETRDAWISVYGLLSEAMKDAGQAAGAQQRVIAA